MFPSNVDYIFVLPSKKGRFKPELSPNLLSTLGPNPIRKAGPTYNFGRGSQKKQSFLRFLQK